MPLSDILILCICDMKQTLCSTKYENVFLQLKILLFCVLDTDHYRGNSLSASLYQQIFR